MNGSYGDLWTFNEGEEKRGKPIGGVGLGVCVRRGGKESKEGREVVQQWCAV